MKRDPKVCDTSPYYSLCYSASRKNKTVTKVDFFFLSPPLTPISPNTPSPPMTPISPGAPAGAAKHTCNHLHTIGGASGHKNICIRCNQKKWPLMRKPSARKAEHQRRAHHGEVTVLAVGRWASSWGHCKCEIKNISLSQRNKKMIFLHTDTFHNYLW